MKNFHKFATRGSCIFLIVFLFRLTAHCQDLEFQHLSTKQGLSQANVWDIHQDRYGFVWIATEDGLNVYDGYSFTVYRNNPDSTSISNSNVRCITQDQNGNLWIGTRFGLNLYNRVSNSFSRFLHDKNNSESISNNDVTSVYVDSKNNLWVGTAQGLNRYDAQKKTFQRFLRDPNNPQSLPHNGINAILEDSQHRMWIGTRGGLSQLREGKCENFFHDSRDQSTVSSNIITSILDGK